MKVKIAPKAEKQLDARRSWWRENRTERELFDEELEMAKKTLAESGETLPIVRIRAKPVRRWLMPRTACHLYFMIEDDTITIVAAWGATRGREPRL